MAQFTSLSMTELGLPDGMDPDRLRREVRAHALARSYLMANAGDVEGLKAISPDLLYFWDDRLGGTLVPEPAISARRPGALQIPRTLRRRSSPSGSELAHRRQLHRRVLVLIPAC